MVPVPDADIVTVPVPHLVELMPVGAEGIDPPSNDADTAVLSETHPVTALESNA